MYQSNILVSFLENLQPFTGLVDRVMLALLSVLTTFSLLVRVTQGALKPIS